MPLDLGNISGDAFDGGWPLVHENIEDCKRDCASAACSSGISRTAAGRTAGAECGTGAGEWQAPASRRSARARRRAQLLGDMVRPVPHRTAAPGQLLPCREEARLAD